MKTIRLNKIFSTLAMDLNATGFTVVGTVMDSEHNKVIVAEFSGSEMVTQNNADYYMSEANGFTDQDLNIIVYGLENEKEVFQIIR